jgi:hypothetical protein
VLFEKIEIDPHVLIFCPFAYFYRILVHIVNLGMRDGEDER